MPAATRVHYRRGRGGRGARSESREAPARRAAKRRGGCCCRAGKAASSRSLVAEPLSARLLRTKASAPRRGFDGRRLEVLCPTFPKGTSRRAGCSPIPRRVSDRCRISHRFRTPPAAVGCVLLYFRSSNLAFCDTGFWTAVAGGRACDSAWHPICSSGPPHSGRERTELESPHVDTVRAALQST